MSAHVQQTMTPEPAPEPTDDQLNYALRTDAGRRWVARQLAARSVLSEAQLYRALCEAPVPGAEPIDDGRRTTPFRRRRR